MKMRKDIVSIGTLCLLLAGCGGRQATPTPNLAGTLSGPGAVKPMVVQTGTTPVQWTQFNWGDTLQNPQQYGAVVTGPDKNVWYTDYNGHALIKITMSGSTHAYPLVYNGTTQFAPSSLTVGSDGKFYMDTPGASGIIG